MDFYYGLLTAVWLGAASITLWVYHVKTEGAEHWEETASGLSQEVLKLQFETSSLKKKVEEAKLLAAEKSASAEVELQKEPKKLGRTYTWTTSNKKKPKQCKPKHKRSREWDD